MSYCVVKTYNYYRECLLRIVCLCLLLLKCAHLWHFIEINGIYFDSIDTFRKYHKEWLIY